MRGKRNDEMVKLLVHCKVLLERKGAMSMNESRDILLRLIQLIEIMLDGKPETELRPSHHV